MTTQAESLRAALINNVPMGYAVDPHEIPKETCKIVCSELGITPEMVEVITIPTKTCEDGGYTPPCTVKGNCPCLVLAEAHDALSALLEVAGS